MNSQKRFGNDIHPLSSPFEVRAFERQSIDWHIYVGDVVEFQTDLAEGIAALYAAQEEDSVTIHLNCDGGNADVGDSFLYAMQRCQAHIHVVATGRVASLATFILLEADSFEISPFCTILCHSASYGSMGKMSDTLQHAAFTFQQCEKMLRHYYCNFLTDEEIDMLIHGKHEMYMTADEFVERCNKRNEILEQPNEGEDE